MDGGLPSGWKDIGAIHMILVVPMGLFGRSPLAGVVTSPCVNESVVDRKGEIETKTVQMISLPQR